MRRRAEDRWRARVQSTGRQERHVVSMPGNRRYGQRTGREPDPTRGQTHTARKQAQKEGRKDRNKERPKAGTRKERQTQKRSNGKGKKRREGGRKKEAHKKEQEKGVRGFGEYARLWHA